MRITATVPLALCLAACAPSSYREMSAWNGSGAMAEQMTSDTWRIVARGNRSTAPTTIQDFVLLKAAETAKVAGGTHFIIEDASDVGRRVTMASTASVRLRDGRLRERPGQHAYVKILTLAPGAPAPTNAFNADEIIRYIGPRLKGEEK